MAAHTGVFLLLVFAFSGFALPVSKQRVRREIRQLGQEEREAVFSALNIMKNTSDEQGIALYGKRFISYDSLVRWHMLASSDTRGDQAHLGPAFPTFHRIFGIMMEESLMAVDPRITALPYWDYRIDIEHPRDSVVWEWFGDTVGDASKHNAVTNGRFGHWQVKNLSGSPDMQNGFGLQRAPWNNNPSPQLTRFPTSCGSEVLWNQDAPTWEQCTHVSTHIEWWACTNPGVHTWAHGFLGGIWNAPRNHTREVCFFENTFLAARAWLAGCLQCPAHCQNPNDLTNCTCTHSPELKCLAAKMLPTEGTMGDFADTWSSTNDPIFFFHHANVDRHYTLWQTKHRELAPYYRYPKSWPLTQGQALDDVISSGQPFDPTLAGLPASHGPLKHQDVVQMDGVTKYTPYVYDSLE